MADKEIPDLTAAGGLDGTEEIHIVDSLGNSRKLDLAALKTFINTDPTVVPSSEPWRGARVSRATDITGITWPLLIPWTVEDEDTDGFWSIGDPTKLVIPAGVTRVQLMGAVQMEALATAGSIYASITKNGGGTVTGSSVDHKRQSSSGYNNNHIHLFTAPLAVTTGDYFELRINVSMTGQDQILAGGQTWFALSVIEAS